ncbi:hypothetical protein MGU_09872 [Metarhizium guizhouense ARSEF 977]|uniref:Uncharacterized protein n=1 Tax=Metarhizium guizhouense (strain ARSEF 977) TaxID=1276136 RepID=A0A0B4G812_METGA|nr:hypothetical protein MGU_09872 [Metarhizium guizhouense ARSEF 977]
MKFSYTLVAALVGAVAASPIGEPSLSRRVNTDAVKTEVEQLNKLIEQFQEAKNKKQESKGEGWQQTIDLLKERAAAIEAAPADKVAEEINKLDEPLARIRKSREGAIDRYTRNLFGFVDAKDRLTEAAK